MRPIHAERTRRGYAATVFGRTKEEPPPQARVAGTSQQVVAQLPGAEREEERGPREGLILLLFTLVTLGLVAFVLISEEQDAVDDPVERAARGEITGLDDSSLLREKNFQRVLDDIAERGEPLVLNLRIDPERVNATVRDGDGIRKVLNINAGYETDESDFGAGEDAALPASEIDAGAPERIAREVIKRTGLDEDAVDYVAFSVSTAGTNRLLAMDEGPARARQWTAAADGSDVRRPGEPSVEQRRREACFQKAKDAEAVSRCIERFDQ